MKKLLPKLKALLLFVFVFLLSMQAFAQRQVTGTVTDASSGEALIGATIQIKGTTRGTVTDMSGNYSISVDGPTDVLIFSYVGYDSKEETVGDRSSINETLSEQATQLQDVVVIGYGTVKKNDLTGSVAVVSSEDLNRIPASSFSKALQGRASGVLVSNTSGRPGAGASINVRGVGSITQNSNPIYVIDGVITGNLNAINPSDIESLQVLKDASATAIYGSDGSNGVIIITTKRGQSGKTQVHYDDYFSMSVVPKKFDVMNADQYANFYNTLYARDSITMIPYTDGFRQAYYGPGWQTGTDWQNLITQTGKTQNHYLRVSGGGENSNFSISANYLDQTGILIKTGAKRYNVRANSDFTVSDHLKVGETFNAARQIVRNGDGSFNSANIASPLMRVYDPNNHDGYGFDGPQIPFWYDENHNGIQDSTELYPNTGGSDRDNPLAQATYRDNFSYNNSAMINIYAEYTPVKWLTYRISPSVEFTNSRSYNWYPAFSEGVRSNTRASLEEGYSESLGLMLENQLTFNKTFGDHSLTATAVYQVRKTDGRSIDGIGRGYSYPNLRILSMSDNAAFGDRTLTGFAGSPFRQLSYLGRMIYGYKDKILFTGSIRRDGVSRFGPTNRWGTFPSASVAYKLSEDFLQNVDFINMLKIRAGWGSTGNSAIGSFLYDDFLSGTDAFSPVFGNPQALAPGTYIFYSFANPLIKWEAAKMWNFGVDLNALNNKIQFTAEYYIKNQDDLLVRVPVSMVFGRSNDGSNPWANAGKNQNRGFEFNGTWKDYSGAFKYSVTATLTTMKNEVKYLPVASIFDPAGRNITIVGNTIGSLYGRVAERILQPSDFAQDANGNLITDVDGNYTYLGPTQQIGTSPGDIKFKDLNNDGVINDLDRTIIGKALPDFTYGFNFECSWKNFDFSFFLSGMQNFDVFNLQKVGLDCFVNQDIGNNKLVEFAENYYTLDHPSTTNIRADLYDSNQNSQLSTWWIEKGSFLRVKDIQVGYNVPQKVLNSVGISRVRIYGSAENPFLFTKYTGRDPENAVFGSSSTPTGSGTDAGGYPNPKVLTVGIQVDF